MESSRAGVMIVGAGLIGSSIAWRLAKAGAQVELFDAGRFGGEASFAGAGMLSPGGEFDRPSLWLDLGLESLRLYPAFVEELRSDTGVPIDFSVCGCLQIIKTETELEQARTRAEFQSRVGIRVEASAGHLLYPDDASIDPTDLLRALRCACEKHKVRIAEDRAVAEIEASDYDAIVIAAGAWSGKIDVRYRSHRLTLPDTIPVKGHLLGFQLEPGTVGPIRRYGHSYVLQRSNGFTIAGSNEEQVGFDRHVDPSICATIQQQAAELFPVLKDVTPAKAWIGFRPYSPGSGCPHIGRLPDTNVWLAYGHYRNGILLAPLTAQRIAESILHRDRV